MISTPAYYRKSAVMQSLYKTINNELENLRAELDLTQEQLFLVLAERDLQRHEAEVGIEAIYNADMQKRRNRVLMRLRGTATTTIEVLKGTIAGFVEGSIEIIEHPADYSFTIKIAMSGGNIYDFADIYYAVNEIKPAHLKDNYETQSALNSTDLCYAAHPAKILSRCYIPTQSEPTPFSNGAIHMGTAVQSYSQHHI